MSLEIIETARVLKNSTVVCLARVLDDEGAVLAAASIESITCEVFDLSDPDSGPTYTENVGVDDSIHATLQTDDRWEADTTGYNFAHTLMPYVLSSVTTYQVEYRFTLNNGRDFFVAYKLIVIPTFTTVGS